MALPLTESHIEQLLALLTAPVTAFDCGTLCAPHNGGVPVCCHAKTILPVLYKVELALLRRRSELWRRWQPESAADHRLANGVRPCEVFAVCKGHEHCERHNRSLACRTFPFEAYVDHDRRFAGLVVAYDLADLCPLIRSHHQVQPAFIQQCCRMYERMFELAPDEHELYFRASQLLRRSFGQRRARIPVFTPQGVVVLPTARRGARAG